MIEVVRLIPNDDSIAELFRQPLVVLHCGEFVLCSHEECSWYTELLKRYLRWSDLTVLFHVDNRSVVEPLVDIRVLATLHVENCILVSAARWVVFEEHCQSTHVIDLIVASRDFVKQIAAKVAEVPTEELNGRLLEPVQIE